MSFVRNAWYMAAWSHAVTDKPVAVTVLGDPLVIFRAADGTAGILLDVCPHRAVPLSMGTVSQGHLVCPYRGIELDTAGVCRRNPHVQGSPERLRARAFPAAERFGGIWVWPGDAALADPARIPDYSWFDSPAEFSTRRGHTHV